jgi:hypothetical protein
VLAQGVLELGQLRVGDEAFVEQRFAKAADRAGALLGRRDDHEVLGGDHLVMHREPPQQHVFCRCAHVTLRAEQPE